MFGPLLGGFVTAFVVAPLGVSVGVLTDALKRWRGPRWLRRKAEGREEGEGGEKAEGREEGGTAGGRRGPGEGGTAGGRRGPGRRRGREGGGSR